jgi:prepilin-type N-terminal cleavage/methylation domain-containing protein
MNLRLNERTRESGFSLIELIIAMVLLGIILAALFGTVTHSQKRYVEGRATIRTHETLGLVEQTMTRLFRSARSDPQEKKLSGITPNPLNHSVWDNVAIRSDFNPADGDVDDLMEDVEFSLATPPNDTLYVRWKKGEPITAMAYPVRSLLFQYYATNGTLLTSVPEIVGAARVKITITVPGKPGAPLITRAIWVTIRN